MMYLTSILKSSEVLWRNTK